MSYNHDKNANLPLEKTAPHLKLTACEAKILKIARYYFMTFSEPSKQTWLDANDYAIKNFSSDLGPYVSLAILSVIQSMREVRQSTFKLNNPDCKICSAALTEHEIGLLNTIRCKVSGRDDAAAAHAFIICECNDSSHFLNANSISAAMCFSDGAEMLG